MKKRVWGLRVQRPGNILRSLWASCNRSHPHRCISRSQATSAVWVTDVCWGAGGVLGALGSILTSTFSSKSGASSKAVRMGRDCMEPCAYPKGVANMNQEGASLWMVPPCLQESVAHPGPQWLESQCHQQSVLLSCQGGLIPWLEGKALPGSNRNQLAKAWYYGRGRKGSHRSGAYSGVLCVL